MKKLYVTTLLIFVLGSELFAQVGGIKNGSDNNKPKNNSSTSGSKGDSGGCLSDACCSSGCSDWFIQSGILGLAKLQQHQLEKKKDIPEVVSFEFMPHFGYAEPSSSMLLPRIRGNWGVFSTDLRFSNMVEYDADGIDFYNTIDWQALVLNLVITKPVIARLGTGIMYEYYSKSTFIEHFLGVDVNWKDHLYLASGEFRIAKDYSTGATPRLEGNARLNYRILDNPHFKGYAMIGSIFQNYYSSVTVWTIQTGLTFHLK